MVKVSRMQRCQTSKHRISAQDQGESAQSEELSRPQRNQPTTKHVTLGKSSQLVLILRRITAAVQVFPFVYTGLFVFLFTAYSFIDKESVALNIIDYAVFVSPMVVVAHLVYSRMLKMCKWHRLACALPLLPQAVDQFDLYVYHFGHNAWIVVTATILITMLLFLFCIYKVFFTDEGRIC